MLLTCGGLIMFESEMTTICKATGVHPKYFIDCFTYTYQPVPTRPPKRVCNYMVFQSAEGTVYQFPRMVAAEMRKLVKSMTRKWTTELERIFEVDNRLLPRDANLVPDLTTDIVPCDTNQRVVARHVLDNCFTPAGGGALIPLPAGYGKTYLSIYLICQLRRRALVIVPNTIILQQWRDILNRHITKGTVGTFYGRRKVLGDITLMTIQSAVIKRAAPTTYTDLSGQIVTKPIGSVFDAFDILVLDEAHLYCGDNMKRLLFTGQRPYIIGLSATVEREDGFETVLYGSVGPPIILDKIVGFDARLVDFSARVTAIRYYGDMPYTNTEYDRDGTPSFARTLAPLIRDPCRNKIIHDEIMRLVKLNHDIFVFSDRVEHLAIIYASLIKSLRRAKSTVSIRIDDKDMCGLVGGADTEQIQQAQGTKLILTTYGYASTGVSIPRMTALVLATPRRRKMEQILGRIFRMGSDESITRDIVDIVDVNCSFINQYRAGRRRDYTDRGFTITEETAHFEPPTRHMYDTYGHGNWLSEPSVAAQLQLDTRSHALDMDWWCGDDDLRAAAQ
jgi:superfamily II DNA or RNA helicase